MARLGRVRTIAGYAPNDAINTDGKPARLAMPSRSARRGKRMRVSNGFTF